jgi:hypothetical protein
MQPGLVPAEPWSNALRCKFGPWRLSRVQSVFGDTTEIMKEIIGRRLSLSPSVERLGRSGPDSGPVYRAQADPTYLIAA